MPEDGQLQREGLHQEEAIKVSLATRQVFVKQTELALTGLEYNLLTLLLAYSPKIVCYEIIAEQVFQQPYLECKASLCTHICHLRSKFMAIDKSLRIKSVRGQGYYLVNQQCS